MTVVKAYCDECGKRIYYSATSILSLREDIIPCDDEELTTEHECQDSED